MTQIPLPAHLNASPSPSSGAPKLLDPSVRFRVAVPDDAERLSVFAKKCFEATFRGTTEDENLDDYLASSFSKEIQFREICDKRSTVLLAFTSPDAATEHSLTDGSDEVWLGYARVVESPPEDCVSGPLPRIEIQRVYVDNTVIRAGVGARLLAKCLEDVAKRGGRTAWLGVWENNHRAIAFYEKHGFKKCGDHHFVLGTDAQTDFIYQLEMPQS
eukprot:TRINITY_DN35466_c0_g1_i1.p1 TRINITY_DN35466_c0_g1~~TRINITY_DN35466_c0_g1_i1.p1  ORF type:complete len:215 (+),score=17.79 TRINITY_DN35466_c0_g1_i1:206-850(+)